MLTTILGNSPDGKSTAFHTVGWRQESPPLRCQFLLFSNKWILRSLRKLKKNGVRSVQFCISNEEKIREIHLVVDSLVTGSRKTFTWRRNKSKWPTERMWPCPKRVCFVGRRSSFVFTRTAGVSPVCVCAMTCSLNDRRSSLFRFFLNFVYSSLLFSWRWPM